MFLSTAPRPALEHTQPPIHWVLGAVFPGIKQSEREGDHSPPSTEVKNVGAIPPFSHTSSWRGA
jgi:hypothetical protein